MPRFAANLTTMFNEYAFLDRFKAAADEGFEVVEFLFPYEFDADLIAKLLNDNDLTAALFNLPPGDWVKGERGLASLTGREQDFRKSVLKARDYAKQIGVQNLHVMAGLSSLKDPDAMKTYRTNLAFAVEIFEEDGANVLIEPINNRNMPGYAMNSFDLATSLISDFARPNFKLQFDIYHCQIIHGDVSMRLRDLMPIIGHIQMASVPSRHEPDDEELNYEFIFDELDRLNYRGFVGCEYIPRGKTADGLSWFKPWRRR